MLTIVMLAAKGGAGQTTLALHLAVEAARRKRRAVLIDIDPQASAAVWGDSRDERDRPAVVSCVPARLPQTLVAAKDGCAKVAIIASTVLSCARSAAAATGAIPNAAM